MRGRCTVYRPNEACPDQTKRHEHVSVLAHEDWLPFCGGVEKREGGGEDHGMCRQSRLTSDKKLRAKGAEHAEIAIIHRERSRKNVTTAHRHNLVLPVPFSTRLQSYRRNLRTQFPPRCHTQDWDDRDCIIGSHLCHLA